MSETSSGAWMPSTAEPSGGDSPLLDFEGDLVEVVPIDREATGDNGQRRQYRVIQFKFINVQVHDATEPYPFPVADLTINYAEPGRDRGNSRWAHLTNSMRRVFAEDPSVNQANLIPSLVGKHQRWARRPGKVRQQVDGEWVDHEIPCWNVVEVAGVTSSSGAGGGAQASNGDLLDYVIELADGKTEQAFYQAALEDQRVIRDPSVVTALTNRTFINDMVNYKRLTRSPEGVLSKV